MVSNSRAFEDVFRKPSTYASENACFHDWRLVKIRDIFHLDHCESKVENSWSRCYLEDFRSTDSKHDVFLCSILVLCVYWGGGLHWRGFSFIILNMWILHSAQAPIYLFWGQVLGWWFNEMHIFRKTMTINDYCGAPARTDWNTFP